MRAYMSQFGLYIASSSRFPELQGGWMGGVTTQVGSNISLVLKERCGLTNSAQFGYLG